MPTEGSYAGMITSLASLTVTEQVVLYGHFLEVEKFSQLKDPNTS